MITGVMRHRAWGRRECSELVSDSAAPVDLGWALARFFQEMQAEAKAVLLTEGSDLRV